jgi:hypothetical protein
LSFKPLGPADLVAGCGRSLRAAAGKLLAGTTGSAVCDYLEEYNTGARRGTTDGGAAAWLSAAGK